MDWEWDREKIKIENMYGIGIIMAMTIRRRKTIWIGNGIESVIEN